MSFVLLIVQLWLFAGLMLGLHRISPRFGLTPLLFAISGIVAMLNFVELFGLFVEPYPGIVIRLGAHIFVPMILLAVLTLYIVNGTHTAQLILFGLTGVNGLVLVVLVFMLLHLGLTNGNSAVSGLLAQQDVINLHFVRGVIAATVTFFANMLVIVIFYQGVRNAFPRVPIGLTASLALVAALWTDSILYNLLSNVGTANFSLWLPGDVLAKTLSGVIIAPIAAYYLTRVVPGMPGYDAGRRRTFDILFGTLGNLESTLRSLQGELRESKRTYQQLTDNIDEVFWLATVGSGRIEYISPAFERITGFQRDPFYDDPNRLMDILHEDDQQRMPDGIIQHIYRFHDDEFRLRRQDGEVRWVRNRVFPIRNDAGEIYRIAGIFEDVTERKQIAEREFALALEREKVQMLHDFVRDSSHDLKSPLAAILFRVHLVEHAEDDDTRAANLRELRAHAERLSEMIDDLFTLSRLESNGISCTEVVDFNAIARQVYDTLRPLTDSKGLNFIIELSPQAPSAIGDADEMQRVLLNLVDNAIRYTPSGTITLRVAEDAAAVRVEVSDTGMGISQDDLPKVFNRFYRSQAVRANGIGGTGLGLAIVKTIVDGHQGAIRVESRVGSGTTFAIQIPKTQPENQLAAERG